MNNEGGKSGGQSQQTVGDVNENKGHVAYESFDRAVKEKKKAQSQVNDLQEQLKTYELEKQMAEGKKDDVINSLRTQLQESNSKLETTQKTFAWNAVEGQIKAEATKQGCVNAEKLVKLLGKDQLSGIQVGDDFSVNQDDLSRIVETAKKEHSDIGLFTPKKVNINNPPANGLPPVKPKSIDEMSDAELKQAILNAHYKEN